MAERPQDLSAIVNRLHTLECQNRRMKVIGLTAVLLVGCAALMGAESVRGKVLEAQKIVLKNADGKPRCSIEVDDKGNVLQTMADAKGNPRIRLMVEAEGTARLRMFDEKGIVRVYAATFPDQHKEYPGSGTLGVAGPQKDKPSGLHLATDKDGIAFQELYDTNGERRGEFSIYKEGWAVLRLYAPEKAAQSNYIALGTATDGTAVQEIATTKGEKKVRRFISSVDCRGIGFHCMYDENEKMRVQGLVVPKGTEKTGIAADGYASQAVFDNRGTIRVDTTTYGDGQCSTDHRDALGRLRLSTIIQRDGNAFHKHLDTNGQVRVYAGTYTNGQSGLAFLGKSGGSKVSTMVKSDDSVSHYVDKGAGTQAWEAYKNVKDVIQLGQDAKYIYDLLKKKQ
jgi:hypothetical protein